MACALLNDFLSTRTEEEDETGWKYLHGDVFRFPPHISLFSAMLGVGTQVLCARCVYVCVSQWVCVSVCVCVCAGMLVYMCKCVCVCVCVLTCMSVSVCRGLYNPLSYSTRAPFIKSVYPFVAVNLWPSTVKVYARVYACTHCVFAHCDGSRSSWVECLW